MKSLELFHKINVRSFFIFVFLLTAINVTHAITIPWESSKSITFNRFTIESTREFSNCVLSPDKGSGWDNCSAYIVVKDSIGGATVKSDDVTLSFKKLSDIRNVFITRIEGEPVYKETQICEDDPIRTENPCRIVKTMEFTDVPSVSTTLIKNTATAYKISFQKKRWTRNSFNVSIGTTKLDPDIGVCGTLSTADSIYTLNTSVSSETTCFNVTASNVTIDCNGNSINYSYLTSGNGISSYAPFTTIKNCLIFNNATAASHAIYALDPGDNLTAYNNTISVFGSTSYGVLLNYSDSGNVSENNISMYGASSAYGIYVYNSSYNNISHNFVRSNSSSGFTLIVRNRRSTFNNITDNTFYGYGTSSYPAYIGTGAPSNNTFYRNVFNATQSTSFGVILLGSTQNNSFYGNTIQSRRAGVRLSWITVFGTYANNTGNNFTNDVIIPCTSGCAADYADVQINHSSNARFLNVSFNRTNVTIIGTDIYNLYRPSTLTVGWYVRANVTDESANPLVATSNISSDAGVNVTYEDTDATGLTQWREFTEFIANQTYSSKFAYDAPCVSGSNVTCFQPVNITANKTGYATNYTTLNIIFGQTVLVILTSTGSPVDAVKVSLWINGTESNWTGGYYPNASFNISAVANVSGAGIVVEIYQNNSYIATGNTVAEYIKTLGVGTYYFQGRYNGSTGNVSVQNSSILWVQINNGTVLLTLSSNVTWETSYGNTSNISCSSNVSGLPFKVYRNATDEGVEDTALLAPGTYGYVCNNTGNENYSNASITAVLRVNKGVCGLHLALNGAESDLATTFPITVNASGWKDCPDGILYLLIDGVNVSSGINPVHNTSSYYSEATITYSLNFSNSENYSDFILTRILSPEAINTAQGILGLILSIIGALFLFLSLNTGEYAQKTSFYILSMLLFIFALLSFGADYTQFISMYFISSMGIFALLFLSIVAIFLDILTDSTKQMRGEQP